jgi:hypothetical protein
MNRQRVTAVRVLQAMGHTFRGGERLGGRSPLCLQIGCIIDCVLRLVGPPTILWVCTTVGLI